MKEFGIPPSRPIGDAKKAIKATDGTSKTT